MIWAPWGHLGQTKSDVLLDRLFPAELFCYMSSEESQWGDLEEPSQHSHSEVLELTLWSQNQGMIQERQETKCNETSLSWSFALVGLFAAVTQRPDKNS